MSPSFPDYKPHLPLNPPSYIMTDKVILLEHFSPTDDENSKTYILKTYSLGDKTPNQAFWTIKQKSPHLKQKKFPGNFSFLENRQIKQFSGFVAGFPWS